MTNVRSIVTVAALVLALGGSAVQAAPLGLATAFPDISVTSNVTTTYNATSDGFSVSGGISQYSPAVGVSKVAGNGTGGTGLTLSAVVDAGGALQSGGTLVINGIVPQLGIVTAQNLLTANLTAFGYSGTGASTVFEFKGTVTGGTLASAFGTQVGAILNPGSSSNFSGTFAGNFSGSLGTVDVFAIPEPATLAALALGGAAAFVRRSRRA